MTRSFRLEISFDLFRLAERQANQSQEFVVGGYTPGNPFDALMVGCYDGPPLKFVSSRPNSLFRVTPDRHATYELCRIADDKDARKVRRE